MTNTQCRRGTCTRENLQGEGQQDIGYKVYHANHDPSDIIISFTQEIVPLCL